jgi:hypothetical protein
VLNFEASDLLKALTNVITRFENETEDRELLGRSKGMILTLVLSKAANTNAAGAPQPEAKLIPAAEVAKRKVA